MKLLLQYVAIVTLSISFALLSLPASAAVVVDPTGGGDFREIQPAIDAAAPGEEILVKPGEYRLTQPITFRGKDIHLKSDLGSAVTTLRFVGTIDNEARRAVVRFVDGETNKAQIEGFTITCDDHFADGVYCEVSAPRIIACTIVANRRGVVALGWEGRPIVERSRITDSLRKGVWCSLKGFITLTECSIDQNAGVGIDVGGAGGEESGAEIDRCAIVRNSNADPVSPAGGIQCSAANRVTIRETLIEQNSGAVAGAIHATDLRHLLVLRCQISGNHGGKTGAIWLGGDSTYRIFENCLIYANYGGNWGFLQNTGIHGSMGISNCTIASNQWGSGGLMTCGGSYPHTRNCIFWNNGDVSNICPLQQANIIGSGDAAPYVSDGAYTFPELRFQTLVLAGQERQLPDFIIAPPDFHLTPDSLAIDAGTSDSIPLDDYDGNSRPRGLGVDIGAYESGEEPTEWIIDNADPDADVNKYGSWTVSGAPTPWGPNSLYSRAAGASFDWAAILPSAGSYEVFVWWTAWSSRHTQVPYTVTHAFGVTTLNVNQRVGGGEWHSLGVFSFTRTARVSVRSLGGGSTSADAVRIVRVDGPPTPPPIVIDDGSSDSFPVYYHTSSTGTWSVSGAASPWGSRSLFSKQTGAEYRYRIRFPEPGTWEVFLWWTSYPSRSSSVPIVIDYGTGASTLHVNQLVDGGRWNSLGVYSFEEQADIKVISLGGSSTCADALKLVGVPGLPPPPPQTVIVNDGDPGTSSTGTWLVSAGADPWGGQSLYSKQVGAEYRFLATLPASGAYEVFLWWTSYPSRLTDVPVTIETASGEKRVYVNQRYGGGWNSVGIHDFAGEGAVHLLSRGGGTTCADAVSFVPRAAP